VCLIPQLHSHPVVLAAERADGRLDRVVAGGEWLASTTEALKILAEHDPTSERSGGHRTMGRCHASYQPTPEILGRWRATEHTSVRPTGPIANHRVSHHHPREPPVSVGRHQRDVLELDAVPKRVPNSPNLR